MCFVRSLTEIWGEGWDEGWAKYGRWAAMSKYQRVYMKESRLKNYIKSFGFCLFLAAPSLAIAERSPSEAAVPVAQDKESAVGASSASARSTQTNTSGNEAAPQTIQADQTPSVQVPLLPKVVNAIQPVDAEVTKKNSDAEIQRRDLQAQESMASAAWAMFWSAVMQVAIGGLSIYLIFLTLRETRRTLAEAEKATKASENAANAAMKSIDVSRDIANAQARPWVSVDCSISERFERHVDGVSLVIRCIAKNHGSSPATNVMFRAEMGVRSRESGDLMAKFCDRFRDIPDQATDAIFPGETKEFQHFVFLPTSDIMKSVADFAEEEFKAVSPVVYGLIHYKSHHTAGIRQTRFHYHLTEIRDGGTFVFTPDVDNWPNKRIALFGLPSIAAD